MLTIGPFTPARKLNAAGLTPWQHHRGGWKFVCGLIAEHLHCEDGVRFIGSVEDEVASGKGSLRSHGWASSTRCRNKSKVGFRIWSDCWKTNIGRSVHRIALASSFCLLT